jgi:hypothetical protein
VVTITVVVLLAGCAGTRTMTVTRVVTVQAQPHVPAPPLAQVVPPGYRALKVYRAKLSGGPVPDVVVTSTGPPTGLLRAHHDDLQVLSWDPIARRWADVFDAQKVDGDVFPSGPQESNNNPGYPYGFSAGTQSPILDGKAGAQVSVDQVRFAPLLGTKRDQLVFSATYVAAGGTRGILAIVDVDGGVANVLYTWSGHSGLGSWRIAGDAIHASANYFAPDDAECCPVRTYRFVLSARGGSITEVADDRPFLGVIVRPDTRGLAVVDVAARTPAAGRIRPGDVILDIENAPPAGPNASPVSQSIFNKLARFRAGQTARILIGRGGIRLVESIKLASLSAPAAEAIMTPTNDGSHYAT